MCCEDSGAPQAASATRGMDRRGFLKISAAGIAGAALLGMADPARVFARPQSSLVAEFKEAARRYNVPAGLLMAMGYVNTRWEMPPPRANEYEKGDLHGWGSYGIMALVENPTSDTLGEASRLTGIPKERLKTDRFSNILGGAALLAASQGGRRPRALGGWLGAVAGRGGAGRSYEAVSGVGSGELYASQVAEVMERGAEKRVRSGERLTLPARNLARPVRKMEEL
jgi:hypothetical protein